MHCRPGERRSESSGRHSELTASLISVNIVGNKAGPEIALVAHRPHHAALYRPARPGRDDRQEHYRRLRRGIFGLFEKRPDENLLIFRPIKREPAVSGFPLLFVWADACIAPSICRGLRCFIG